MEIGVLVISDDKHDVGDNEVASSEVAKMGERVGKTLGMQIRLASPQKLLISNYRYHICILLINANFLIYICHILCQG